MSDQDRTKQREHWQAIAEQLGLSPESEPSASETPGPASEVSRHPESPVKSSEPDITTDESPSFHEEPEIAPVEEVPMAQEASAAPGVPEAETDVSKEPSLEAERPDRKGRRRRRRGRGEKTREAGEAEPSTEKDASQPAEAPSEETEEEPERPNRGRGRKRATKESRQPVESEPEEDTGSQESETDDEIEELGDFSNWNVPSWNELIASLYRPER